MPYIRFWVQDVDYFALRAEAEARGWTVSKLIRTVMIHWLTGDQPAEGPQHLPDSYYRLRKARSRLRSGVSLPVEVEE